MGTRTSTTEEEEIDDYKLAEVELFLSKKLPEILKEIARLPEPKTKEQKEKEFYRNFKSNNPLWCPVCGWKIEVDPYLPTQRSYIEPAKLTIDSYEINVNHEELRTIGDVHNYLYVVYGYNYNETWKIVECPICNGKDMQVKRQWYEPKFEDDKTKDEMLQAKVRYGIDDILHPYDYDDYYDD